MNKNLIVTVALIALVALSFALGAFLSLREKSLGGGLSQNEVSCTASSTTFNIVPTTSVAMLPSAGRRCGFFVSNRVGFNQFPSVYYEFASSADGFKGVLVAASSTGYWSNFGNDINYTGAVSLIGYATGTVSVTEFRY